jgi:hypothetical protein
MSNCCKGLGGWGQAPCAGGQTPPAHITAGDGPPHTAGGGTDPARDRPPHTSPPWGQTPPEPALPHTAAGDRPPRTGTGPPPAHTAGRGQPPHTPPEGGQAPCAGGQTPLTGTAPPHTVARGQPLHTAAGDRPPLTGPSPPTYTTPPWGQPPHAHHRRGTAPAVVPAKFAGPGRMPPKAGMLDVTRFFCNRPRRGW